MELGAACSSTSKMQNTYSWRWFEVFGGAVDPTQTAREVEFLCRHLPQPQFGRVLDVCCGVGRHAIALGQRGYCVIGIDVDKTALNDAMGGSPTNVDFRLLDMRSLDSLTNDYGAVLCMWQSFGQFDDQMNLDVLKSMAARLRRRGRMVLDVYHRAFFETRQGTRTLMHGTAPVVETKKMIGDRLRVHLEYGDDRSDLFEWRLYDLEQWRALGETIRCPVALRCTMFDESKAPSIDQPRMQLVMERM